MKKEKIERNILEKVAQDFIETRKGKEDQRMLVSRTERQAHFEQNYKKK